LPETGRDVVLDRKGMKRGGQARIERLAEEIVMGMSESKGKNSSSKSLEGQQLVYEIGKGEKKKTAHFMCLPHSSTQPSSPIPGPIFAPFANVIVSSLPIFR
jgi:hypothetical protein